VKSEHNLKVVVLAVKFAYLMDLIIASFNLLSINAENGDVLHHTKVDG
jgi:hypothetical protein